jgi:hypothetical protein
LSGVRVSAGLANGFAMRLVMAAVLPAGIG